MPWGWYTKSSATQLIKYLDSGTTSTYLFPLKACRSGFYKLFCILDPAFSRSPRCYTLWSFLGIWAWPSAFVPDSNWRICILTLSPDTCVCLYLLFQSSRLHFLPPHLGLAWTAPSERVSFQAHMQRYVWASGRSFLFNCSPCWNMGRQLLWAKKKKSKINENKHQRNAFMCRKC